MESQPQNPEFRNIPENFHPCTTDHSHCVTSYMTYPFFFDSNSVPDFSSCISQLSVSSSRWPKSFSRES